MDGYDSRRCRARENRSSSSAPVTGCPAMARHLFRPPDRRWPDSGFRERVTGQSCGREERLAAGPPAGAEAKDSARDSGSWSYLSLRGTRVTGSHGFGNASQKRNCWGATPPKCTGVFSPAFQSTPPRGGRHTGPASGHGRSEVSIHAPAWGATKALIQANSVEMFQSTPPRGGRQVGTAQVWRS